MGQLERTNSDETDYLSEVDLTDVERHASHMHVWLLPSEVELRKSDAGMVIVSRHGDGAPVASDAQAWGALVSFLALADGPDAKVLNFVRRRGALCVGDDGRPLGYRPMDPPLRERLYWYREYARLLLAVLRSAARLRRRSPLLPADAEALRAHIRRIMQPQASKRPAPLTPLAWLDIARAHLLAGSTGATATDRIAARRLIIAGMVKWWTEVGTVRELLYWESAAPRLEWSGGLWGAIGAQLTRAVLRDTAPVTCSLCGRPIERRVRRPKVGQPTYCNRSSCRRERETMRKREQRAKRKR